MNDLLKAIEFAEDNLKKSLLKEKGARQDVATDLWKAMDADFDTIIKGHVAGYTKTTASGAAVHVNDYENGRGSHYKHGAGYGKHHWDKGHIGGHDAAIKHYETKTGKKLDAKGKSDFISGYKNSQNVEHIHAVSGGDKQKLKENRTKVVWH